MLGINFWPGGSFTVNYLLNCQKITLLCQKKRIFCYDIQYFDKELFMYVLGSKRTSLTITVYKYNKCSVPTHMSKMLCQLKTNSQKQIVVYTDIINKIGTG